MPEDLRNVRPVLQIEGIDGALVPASIRIEESFHAPRRITIELLAESGSLPPASLLRKGAQLDVLVGGTSMRRFEGIVLRVREAWHGAGAAYTLTIGSPLDYLALSTDCRIFQEKTVPEIVEQVLLDAGFPAARIVKRLSGTYAKLASCTQYAETMLSFVTRILADEGAFLFLEDGDGGLDLVLGDAADAYRAAKHATLPYVIDRGAIGPPAIVSLLETDRLRPAKVTLRDLDWQKPDLDLEAMAESTSPGARELYDHPGGYTTPADGKKRAKTRLEAIVAATTRVSGLANVPTLSPGRTFELEGAPRADLAQAWLVTAVVHAWVNNAAGAPWSAQFQAIPKSTPYRAPLAPRPRIAGAQSAIVTGPSGKEIHTDEHARVKLKFPWDRHAQFDDKSAAWVRVAQSAMSGAIAVPRVGWEVLVEFEHGDPDRPVVVGRLFNAMYLPPYALPAKKTVSTLMSFSSPDGTGHNEIRIDDAAGSEHIHMHAQKDLALTVTNDRTTTITTSRMVTIKADEAVTVKGNRSLEVKGMWQTTVAGSQTLSVDGERKKTVKKDEKVTVNGDRKISITGSHKVSTEANATLGVEGDVACSVTGTLTETADEATSIVIGDDMSVTVGAAKSETAKKGKSSTTDGKRTVTVGAAMMEVSGADLSVLVGGKQKSTVGAAWNVTSAADVQVSSSDALEITVGAAMTLTGATAISFKVGSSKVLVGQGGVVIEASKIKITSDGPAAVAGAMVGSK